MPDPEKPEDSGAGFAPCRRVADFKALPAEKLVNGRVDKPIAATISCAAAVSDSRAANSVVRISVVGAGREWSAFLARWADVVCIHREESDRTFVADTDPAVRHGWRLAGHGW
jgi:hypothetical protein